jgi:hypothetical protein
VSAADRWSKLKVNARQRKANGNHENKQREADGGSKKEQRRADGVHEVSRERLMEAMKRSKRGWWKPWRWAKKDLMGVLVNLR